MLASPTITWSRRYFSGSACGSSRVLMMGRECIVSRPTSVSRKSARWETWYSVYSRLFSDPTLPAPVKIWRVTRKGIMYWTIRVKGQRRSMR